MLALGSDKERYHSQLVPHLCFNRYDVAEGVSAYSQATWRQVMGKEGRTWVARCLLQVSQPLLCLEAHSLLRNSQGLKPKPFMVVHPARPWTGLHKGPLAPKGERFSPGSSEDAKSVTMPFCYLSRLEACLVLL